MSMPAQSQQHQPGREAVMNPRPEYEPRFPGSGRLEDKVVLITGGDSGIGRAVAVAAAREGADVVIVYLEENEDARETVDAIAREGGASLAIAGDVGSEAFCQDAVRQTMERFGRLDVLINNAAEQHTREDPADFTEESLERTFRTNIFSFFFMVKAAMPHLKRGASIINTTSITAFQGHEQLLDYSATKGAILTYTRSLSQRLASEGIRVNAVAPGPIWTPLIPASFDEKHTAEHGKDAPLGRPGQPNEVAPAFIFLASEDASYITGQVIHPNGGTPT